ncbi:SurA N-terminal domain-containing protein [Paracoccus sp. Z118]|uniref:peptidylprolyl isomerase n=1 Tax=Paracoccus sp. Z118 TaxID=2851017 RepID=UPI001C2CB92C|nr:peptidylprolyl isomerase [Paracoccus sp. Z118]MBV0891015.1 SurA N-terminal domain-containing protein [Paracoccus sp. Z118]
MSTTRTKGKSPIVWLLMGLLLLGLGGFGVTNFSGSSSGDLGRVGSTPVEADDYLRAVNSEMRNFAAQTGQNLTAEQARQFGLPQVVQARLFAAAALEDEAKRLGVSAGDELVAEQIRTAGAFQNLTGQFDAARYNEVLRQQGLTPAEFEHDVRMDQARLILQSAVVAGVEAPEEVTARTAGWLLQTRDFGWQELTDADLPEPIAPPDEPALQAWHEANGARFTAPETRRITFAWLTPEMLVDSVELDEQALRDMYEQNIDQYRQPERRMVERLVYPSEEEALAAKARLDAGQASFEQLTNERGLELTDIDMGEVSEAELGAAGAPVFALDQPGVVGPIMTDFGPALFSMNAILDAVDIPFEQAAIDLRAEAAADAARRQIETRAFELEDRLAGGATLEELAGETGMELGSIDWTDQSAQEHGTIAAYPEFRDRADALQQSDFPELTQLGDGGVFAMRLDELVPPALIPFEEAREDVLADWTAAERRRRLQAVAEERKLAAMAGPADPAAAPAATAEPAAPASVPAAPARATGVTPAQPAPAGVQAPQFTPATGLSRDGFIDGVPADVIATAFQIAEPGDAEVVTTGDRVFLVRLDAVHEADLTGDDAAMTMNAVRQRLTGSLQGDLFEYYARAIQTANGLEINAGAIAAANAQIQ